MSAPLSRRPQDSRQRASRAARSRRAPRVIACRISTFLGNAAFLLLGLAVVGLGAALMLMNQRPSSGSAASGSVANQAESRMANTQTTTGDWIPLRSKAPADIIAAARQSSLFQQNLTGNGDHVTNVSRLGAPLLVGALQPAGAAAGQYPDFYIVPILNTSGAATDAAELELNPTHTAIQVIAIVTYSQPHEHGAIARMTAAASIKAVQAQHHSALRSNTAPRLIYFPADAASQGTGQVTWTGGGEFPADPIWLIPGSDGRNHLAGEDGRAYYQDQLPMVKAGG